ncbi:Trm112 family protein [bacterium]|nr:Trm112 family protein [bacterium]
MSLDSQLLKILACPQCKAQVKLTQDEKALKCMKCHRVYPIKENIPVMLIEEATIEPERNTKD